MHFSLLVSSCRMSLSLVLSYLVLASVALVFSCLGFSCLRLLWSPLVGGSWAAPEALLAPPGAGSWSRWAAPKSLSAEKLNFVDSVAFFLAFWGSCGRLLGPSWDHLGGP